MKHVSRIALAATVAGTLLAGPVHALVKWNFVDANCVSGGCSDADRQGNVSRTWEAFQITDGETPANVTATGWANTSPGAQNDTLAQGIIPQFGSSGIGVQNADRMGDDNEGESSANGEHAVDNVDRYDLVLFHFEESVSVTEVGIGWFQSDADISLLAWTGGEPADTPNVDGVAYSASNEGLTGLGWTLIGNFDVDTADPDPDQGNGDRDFVQDVVAVDPLDNATIFSSYWIVGAFNPVFDGPLNEGNESDGNGAPYLPDKVKILSLAGNVGAPPPPEVRVPAPGTLLLLAAGLPLLLLRRR